MTGAKVLTHLAVNMGKFANYYQSTGKNGKNRSVAGFTLIEMLAVMGIMLVMLGMLLPAINDALGSRGRKGAVNILLNTFEQARVSALEQSTNVYVGFADGNIPDNAVGGRNAGFAYTRFIVFREYNADIDPATATPPKYVALTKWLTLPKGISFKSGKGTVTDSNSGGTMTVAANDKFPGIAQTYTMPVVEFSNTGIIQMPTSNLNLFIYEGFWSGSSDVFTRSRGNSLFERITFSRFTGRAQLDITSA